MSTGPTRDQLGSSETLFSRTGQSTTRKTILLFDLFVKKDQPRPAQPNPPPETTPSSQINSPPEEPSPAEPAQVKTSDMGKPSTTIEPQSTPEPTARGRIQKPLPYIRDVLTGEGDGGTARGKSKLPKGLQLPTGMMATDDGPDDQLANEVNAIGTAT